MIREYVGARYVPLFDGDWDNTKTYEPLTIVSVANVGSYTSKQFVPAGIDISNTDYWVMTSSTSGQIIALTDRVDALEAAVKTPEKFGAKGDGVTDDTSAINDALAGGGLIVFNAGSTYMIDAEVGLLVDDNTVIDLNGATVEAIANSNGYYEIFHINQKENVVIANGVIVGDRNTHTGNTGEWGMGVYVGGSHDILLDNLKISDCWGDGVYIGDTKTYDGVKCENIRVQNCIIDNCRRQGISVTFAEDCIITKNIITNTHGTAPEGAIDIEPNANLTCKKIIVSDNIMLDNMFAMAVSGAASGSVVEDIIISNNMMKASSSTQHMLQVNNASKVKIEGNMISDSNVAKSLLYIVAIDGCEITNNFVKDCVTGLSSVILSLNDCMFSDNSFSGIKATTGEFLYVLNGSTNKIFNNSFRDIEVGATDYIIYCGGSASDPANSNMIKNNVLIGLIAQYVIAFGNNANNNHIMQNTVYKGAIGVTPGAYDYVAYCRAAAAGNNFVFNDVQAGDVDVCGGSPAFGGTIAQNMNVNTLVP